MTDAFYYLKNFETMLNALQARDADLLNGEERAFMGGFAALPTCSRALLVRMVMRKGALFRAERLRYAEIPDSAMAVLPLVDVKWVDDSPLLTLEELFRLLPKADLAKHLRLPRALIALPKALVLEQLRPQLPEARPFRRWCAEAAETVWRLAIDGLCERLRLMFFGNFRQTLTEFVLADLGVFKYEKLVLPLGSRPFATRSQVEAFHTLYACREKLRAGEAVADVERLLPAPIEDCEWLQDRREKLRFQMARAHERAGAMPAALAIYLTCAYPEAKRCAERLRSKLSAIPRRRVPRKAAAAVVPEILLTIDRGEQQRSVEWLVREHLIAAADRDTSVHYVENALINSLFGLLCWPAVFAPLPGAFFHAFQHGPADLPSAGFVARRASLFAQCFAELQSGEYRTTIRRRFVEKAGVASPFVAWGLVDEELLDTALACFPADHLLHWFEWMLRDLKANRCGFPDLVQFWPAARRYRLIEIKGPGDRLQDNQRRCLEHCLLKQMPVLVCHVRWRA